MLDFWLIGVYTELDVKGNLFSGRKLMLQAIRNNPSNSSFLVEYYRFEVRFFEKVKERIMILNGGGTGEDRKIDFIMDEADPENFDAAAEGRLTSSTKLIEIAFENIVEQFGTKLSVLK